MSPRFRRARRAAARAGLALACLTVLACSRGPSAGGEIRIATALDPKRAGMQSIYNGVELAVEQLNAQYGAQVGRFVQKKGDPNEQRPVAIAGAFREDPLVVGVVGHPETGTTLAAINEYADAANDGRNGVVAVSPTGTGAGLSGANRWLFRVCPSDLQASRAVARYVLDSLRADRVSVIYRNDAYGKDWTKAFADAYREGKGTIVQRDPYLQGITPWDAYAGYIRQLRPAALLFPGSTEDALAALRALRAEGVSVPLIGGDAISGLEANAAEFPNVRYTAFFLPRLATTPVARQFVAAYTAKFNAPPDQRAALAYDAAMLIGRAVAAVGPDRAKIRDWIEKVGNGSAPLDGVAGPIAFDDKHDAVGRTVVVTRVGQ